MQLLSMYACVWEGGHLKIEIALLHSLKKKLHSSRYNAKIKLADPTK